MGTELLVRSATPEDADQILDLVKLSLGEGKIPRQMDYWRWKHEENPFGRSPSLIAVSDGRLVGLRVFMRWNWIANGVTVPAVRAVDTATHPDWRGRGIFSRLTLALLERMKADGVSFVFNTPNSQSRPGYLKMGWVSVGHTSFWVRPLRPLHLIRALIARGNARRDADASHHRELPGAPAAELLRQPALARFLDALRARGNRFATPRSADYLRWRYVAIPGFSYRAAWNLDGERGAVIIVRTKTQGATEEVRVCELLVGRDPTSGRMALELLRSIGRGTGGDYMTAMAGAGEPSWRLLVRAGFLPAPRVGPIMTVRPLNAVANGLNPLSRSSWQLSAGDLELF